MLPRAHRLRHTKGFRRAIRSGAKASSRHIVVYFLPGPTGGEILVGFVVSRAVGRAVARNRVRRRLRHLVADRLADLPPGVLVVRALPAGSDAASSVLGSDLDRLLPRVTGGRSA